MIQTVEDDGTPRVFGTRPHGPNGETLAISDEAFFGRVLRLSTSDIYFRFATGDYIRAITNTRDCATYCYRAIESIKAAIAFKNGVESWQPMHETLGTDRETIYRIVKRFADPVRHGNWIELPSTTGAERFEMLKLTRDILLSYLRHVETEGGPQSKS